MDGFTYGQLPHRRRSLRVRDAARGDDLERVPTYSGWGRTRCHLEHDCRGRCAFFRRVLSHAPTSPGLPLPLERTHKQDGGFSWESGTSVQRLHAHYSCDPLTASDTGGKPCERGRCYTCTCSRAATSRTPRKPPQPMWWLSLCLAAVSINDGCDANDRRRRTAAPARPPRDRARLSARASHGG